MFGKYLLSLLLFLSIFYFSSNQLYAQEEEGEIITISERVGEEIDKEEREKFELFPNIKGFQSAYLLKLPDNRYVFRITYLDEQTGELKIELKQVSQESINNIRYQIDIKPWEILKIIEARKPQDLKKDVYEEPAMVEEKPRDLKHESYPELGVVCSLIMNPTLGYWFGPVGVRVAGMYLSDDHNEFHLNLRYKFSDNENTQQSINLLSERIVGSDPGADYHFTCLGVAYGLNFSIKGYGGFFIEGGMAKVLHDNLGNLKNDPFVPCCTFGYIYRFTP